MTSFNIRIVFVLAMSLLVGTTQTAFAQTPTADPCSNIAGGPAHAQGEMGGMEMSSPAASPVAGMPPIDLAFLVLMGPHHEGAILMSQVTLERAEHPEIRTLAQSIIDSQQAEREQMSAWQQQWYADAPAYSDAQYMAAFDAVNAQLGAPADGGGMSSMDPAADVQKLCTSTAPFDLTFMNMMIPHHQAAVDMANVEQVAGTQPELVAFAAKVIEAQSSEIAQMQGWIDAWYGATPAA